MTHIISPDKLASVMAELRKQHQSIVLAGGCFDILHIGHTRFLRQAKKLGDLLIILLESDETVKRLKGDSRPYFAQTERSEMLAALKSIDVVIELPSGMTDQQYISLVKTIHPVVIAMTEGDPSLSKKQHQAELIGAKLAIISYIETYSTSSLAKLLGVE